MVHNYRFKKLARILYVISQDFFWLWFCHSEVIQKNFLWLRLGHKQAGQWDNRVSVEAKF